jgi:hypothetical protein
MSQTSLPPTNSAGPIVISSTNTSPEASVILANSPILQLLGIQLEGLSESQLREAIKDLRQKRTSAPALKKALSEEDEEETEKAVKKTKKKKDEQKSIDGLLGEYGV